MFATKEAKCKIKAHYHSQECTAELALTRPPPPWPCPSSQTTRCSCPPPEQRPTTCLPPDPPDSALGMPHHPQNRFPARLGLPRSPPELWLCQECQARQDSSK